MPPGQVFSKRCAAALHSLGIVRQDVELEFYNKFMTRLTNYYQLGDTILTLLLVILSPYWHFNDAVKGDTMSVCSSISFQYDENTK